MTYYSGQIDLEYYPSGIIKSYVTLGTDEFQIGGQFIKAAERSKITFHPNGNIKSLFLAENTELVVGKRSKSFEENERLEFLENGNLRLDLGEPFKGHNTEESISLFEAALKLFGG